MSVGENLKKARLISEKEISEVAILLNCSERTIQRWESGEANPSFQVLLKLANLYNASTDYLLDSHFHKNNTVEAAKLLDDLNSIVQQLTKVTLLLSNHRSKLVIASQVCER